MIPFSERLNGNVIVFDGAMGTMLHAFGVPLDSSLTNLNLTQPELVKAIHRSYVASGAEVIQTNTFGASRPRLRRFGLEDHISEINRAGARIALDVARAGDRQVYVAGSIGPADIGFQQC